MAAPRIAALDRLLVPGVQVPILALGELPPSSRLFVVLVGGPFGGLWLDRGDVIACAPAVAAEGLVVLEARGLGRPRLGTACEGMLQGDSGEVCSPLRWSVAGEVVRVVRARGEASAGAGAPGVRQAGPELRVVAGAGERGPMGRGAPVTPGGRGAVAGAQLQLFLGPPPRVAVAARSAA